MSDSELPSAFTSMKLNLDHKQKSNRNRILKLFFEYLSAWDLEDQWFDGLGAEGAVAIRIL